MAGAGTEAGKAARGHGEGGTRDRVYSYVRERLLAGDPPTVREIRDALGLRAVQSVQVHLQSLLREGRLEQEPGQERGRARGYRLPDAQRGPLLVPLLGRVQAGLPTLAVEEPEGYLPIEARAQGDGIFALRVRGQSMRDAGILPGDLVIVRRQQQLDDGDIVVALVGDEATVKTLRRGRQGLELHAAHPEFAPMRPAADELTLLGKVIEVRRMLDRA